MQWRLLSVVVAGAAGVSLAATVAAAPGLRPVKVAYNLEAEFGVGLTLTWSEDEGTRGGPCWSTWSHSEGRNEVNGASSEKMRGAITLVPGALPDGGTKVTLWAVGPGRATAERGLVETGGTNWTASCGGTRPAPFQAPPNDCGEKQYSTKLATIRSERREGFRTLKQWLQPRGDEDALSINLLPTRPAYRTCRVGRYAIEYPASIGVPLTDYDIIKLRKLKPGQRWQVGENYRDWTGKCDRPMPGNVTCRYELDAHVDIRRLRTP